MSSIEETRTAMYGCWWNHTAEWDLSDAWFYKLFDAYTLYPYLELGHSEVNALIFKKTLFSKLVPIFSKRLRVTSILNDAIGNNVFKDNKKGIIEEVAEILLNEIESRKTIEQRIKDTQKANFNFDGVSIPIQHSTELHVLETNIGVSNRKLVSVEGCLVSVDSIEVINPALFKSFQGSGIDWLISDFPYFQMEADNKHYRGGVVGLRFSDELRELTGENMPFKNSCGWHPYVKVTGVFHSSHSPKYPAIRTMDYCWMHFRAPKSFDALPALIGDFFSEEDCSVMPGQRDLEEVLLMLSSVQLSYSANSLTYDNVRQDIHELAERGLSKISADTMPGKMQSFFKDT